MLQGVYRFVGVWGLGLQGVGLLGPGIKHYGLLGEGLVRICFQCPSSSSRLCSWALEYHTLILFSTRNHYEIKVYTFSP